MRALLIVADDNSHLVIEVYSISYQGSTKTLSLWETPDEDGGSWDIKDIPAIDANRIIDEAYKYGNVDLTRYKASWVDEEDS